MFGLRSARSQAILAGALLVVLLAGVATLALWRTRDIQQHHHALEHTSAAASALERANAQFSRQAGILSVLVFSDDPALVDRYHEAAAQVEQSLSQARAEALAQGEADDLLAIDDLSERLGQFNEKLSLGLPILLEADPQTRVQLATTYMSEMWPEGDAIVADLEEMAQEQEKELAAARAAADRAAETTLWLLIGFGAAAFLVAAGTVAMLIMWLVRPLAALRATADAITSGELESRARVSGPEEMASLARAFNEMTDALSAKTEEYITTTNLTGDIIGRVDEEGRWTFLNDAACQFYGKPREELLGTDSRASLHPEDLEPTLRTVEEARDRKAAIKGFVNRQVTPMATRVVEWNACPLFDGDGQYAGIQITGRDISERKRAQEALRESEERFRHVAEAAREWIWESDVKGRQTYCSPAVRDILGYEPEEVIGKSFYDFVVPEDSEQILARDSQGVAQRRTFSHVTYRLVHKDGHVVVVESSGLPILDAKGNVIGYRGANHDISERKQTEEALRESEERYRMVSELTSDYILKLGIDSKNRVALEMMSDSFTRVSGYTLDEMKGPHMWRKAIHPDDATKYSRFLKDVISKGQGEIEIRGLTKKGDPVWLQIYGQAERNEKEQRVCGVVLAAKDISERKRAEEALRESEERYRLLAENASDVIWTMDMNLNTTYMSPANRRLRGYSVEEVMAQGIEESLTPASLEVARKALAEELAIERMKEKDLTRSRTVELEFYRRDGSTVWTESKVTFLRDADGRPVGILGVTRDISERRRAEEALRESEERYRLLAESASDVIWTIDMNLRYTYVSPSVTRLRGYTVEEVMSHTAKETFTPASFEVVMKALAEELAIEKMEHKNPFRSRTLELEQICRDGSTVWTDINVTFLRGPDGKPVGIQGVTRDISERKRAEEALRESESKHRTLLESLPQKIFSKDRNSVYISCNEHYARDLNIEPAEITGKTDHDFYPKELAEKYRADDKRIMKSGKTEDIEERYVQNGQEVFVHTVKTPIKDGNGNVVGILGIFWDITEHKRAEQERARLHAELAVRAVTDGLTGLYNHAHFYQRLAEEIERSKRYGRGFAVVMMDVDNFKHYNDSRGHQAGDEALRLVSDCIRTAIRRSDVGFRYGGDEFAAILPHTDSSRAQTVANRISRRIAARLKEMGNPAAVWLGLSAGIACFPADATTADELVRIADAALYDAKRAARARGVMGRGQAIESPASPSETLDEKQQRVLSTTAKELAAALEDLASPEVAAQLDLRTIAAVGAAAEIKDPYIRGHQERVSQWAAALAGEMGLPPQRVRDIRIAGLLHDVGKVGISASILNKPGKLTEEEFAKVKEHATLGAMIIITEAEVLQQLVPVVRHHHERFDGKGYPDGLASEDIPLAARILSVVDVFDAMTHERAYRKALGRAEAIAELEHGAGTQFDPRVVEAFLALVRRRGEKTAAQAQAASEDKQLATGRAAGRGKG